MKIKTTTDQVVEHITEAIYSGEFSPGSKLKETEISKWLGISRTPIREAFRVLASKGLVEISSNKGVRIPVVTIEELDEICEFRILLEEFCIGRFIENMNENSIHEMEDIVKDMEKAMEKKDYRSYFEHSIGFHAYYIKKCQNSRLYYAFTVMKNTIQCAQLLLKEKPRSYGESIKEHRELLKAMRQRDLDKCKAFIRQHLLENCERMKSVLRMRTDHEG